MGEMGGRAGAWLAGLFVLAGCGGGGAGPGELYVDPAGDGGGAAIRDAGLDAGGRDGGVRDAGGVADAGPDGGPEDSGIAIAPPLSIDGWTFYGMSQGLSATPSDVSADEGGNVYVAGGDTLYVKTRRAASFTRVDPIAAGLTRNCDPNGGTLCPVISVAGGDPGGAVIGFQGIGTDDDNDPMWEQFSGGCDLVGYDGSSVYRLRHVLIATPPGVIRETEYTWKYGRRKGRQVFRVVFNHLPGLHHGDVWMAGTHVGFSVFMPNPAAEGWQDYPNQYPDARGVWEHDHPAVEDIHGDIETGDYYGVAIDPTTGDPWAGDEYRTASKKGYGAGPGGQWNPLWPPYDPTNQLDSYLDVWPDCVGSSDPDCPYDIDNPAWKDNLEALAFCEDGTLYLGSSTLGLKVRGPQGDLSSIPMPAGLGDDIYALACDPADHSVWVGLGWGGIARLHPDGTWSLLPGNLGAPPFVWQPVRSIQIDRWASPRIVYFAHQGTPGGPAGGITAYAGP